MKREIAKDPWERPRGMQRRLLLLIPVFLLLFAGCGGGSEEVPSETAATACSVTAAETIFTDTETTAPRYGELHTP